MVGLDDVLENAGRGEVELVGVAPDGKAGAHVGGVLEAFEKRIGDEVFFVIAMGDDVALAAQFSVGELRRVEAEELGFTNLMSVGEKLAAILKHTSPFAVKLLPCGLALDN